MTLFPPAGRGSRNYQGRARVGRKAPKRRRRLPFSTAGEADGAALGRRDPELERLFDRQSTEADEGRRKKLVGQIERRLPEDGARPIIFYNRFAYCWRPQVKNWTMMVNSIINNFRLQDVWLDK